MPTTITTSDGIDLFVNVKGTGLPCLYIHGGPGSGSYWMEKFSDGMLERHFRMVYLDQRGVARSGGGPDSNFSMQRMVQDFEEVRAALGIQRWLTMGHSLGGLNQVAYALRYPQVQLGLAMLNTTINPRECFRTSWMPKACEFLGIPVEPYLDESVPIIERLGSLGDQLRERDLFWKMAYREKANEETMNRSFGEIPNWNHTFGNIAMSLPDYLADYTAASADIQVPVLFFYSLSDWFIGPEHYKHARFPDLMLWPSDVGHVAIMENKTDLERAIVSFREKYQL
jgi:proline iminopeptidase